MPTRPLPNDPSLENLRKQSKSLRNAARSGAAEALASVREFHPRAEQVLGRFSLSDAQLVTARSYGFASWPKLKQHLAEIEPFVWDPPPAPDPASPVDVFIHLACLAYAGWHRSNPSKAMRLLADDPDLAHASVYTAAAVGEVNFVRAAIEREPSLVNERGGPFRWEPLLYACYSRLEPRDADRSTLEVARLLLSRGADPNAGFLWEGRYAFTALTGAFGRGEDWDNQPPHPECDTLARLLLDAGADPNDGQTLYNRHFREDDSHLRLLLAYGLGRRKGGPWLNRLTDENASPETMVVQQLCWAVVHDFRGRLELLVAHGADVNARCPRSGRTPYQEALRSDNRHAAEVLLSSGARRIGLDPLETFALACIAGRRDEVRALLTADPGLLDRLGEEGRIGMLNRAAEARRSDGIRLIVELGVDINGMIPGTGLARSVLHGAAGGGDVEMVNVLLGLGADPNLHDPAYHATPLGWALHGRQRAVIDRLLPLATIFDAVQADGTERVTALLREDPSLANARDAHGFHVVFYLHPEMTRLDETIQLLAGHGTDFDVTDPEGRTVVDRALARGSIDFANRLRQAGARTAAELKGKPARDAGA